MTHRNARIRPAISAIAAVLALSSTALLAQEAPTPPVTEAPATPGPESAPATATEPSTASDPVATRAEPATTANKTTATRSSKSTTTHRTASAARPATAARPVARAVVAAPVAVPAETVAPAPPPAAAAPAAPPTAVVTAPPAQEPAAASSDMLQIAGAVGLGLLALIGAGVVLRRRKLRRDEEFAAADEVEPEYEAPARADPLFAEQPSAPMAAEPAPVATLFEPALAGPCADAAPGSHVEAACEGPTKDNPSLSIKKRIKRAQFFDQREFLVAAGEAAPVASDAGLPDAVETPAPPTREPA